MRFRAGHLIALVAILCLTAVVILGIAVSADNGNRDDQIRVKQLQSCDASSDPGACKHQLELVRMCADQEEYAHYHGQPFDPQTCLGTTSTTVG